METTFIPPRESWERFKNDEERLDFLRKSGLISAKSEELKQIFYNGQFVEKPVICSIEGKIGSNVTVISIDGNLHCIATDHLKEMQLTKKERIFWGFEEPK